MTKNSSRRIMFAIESMYGAGAERVCVTLANKLIERGWIVTLVVLNLTSTAYVHHLDNRIELISLNVTGLRAALPAFYKLVRERRPEKVLTFGHLLMIIFVVLRLFGNYDFKLFSRNIITLSRVYAHQKANWRQYLVLLLVRLLYRHVDLIICQSFGMAEDLKQDFSIDAAKLRVINNPVAPEIEKAAATSVHSRPGEGGYLLCVGRLDKQKAFHEAIAIFAVLSGIFPDLSLRIVGTGPLEGALRQCAVDHGITDRVVFAGFQEDMAAEYINAKATLLTSLYEGFPNVLVESITLGIPVVAFDCESGPSEIIVDGVNGYLIPGRDQGKFVEALIRLLQNPELFPAEKVAASASRFASNVILDNYEKVLSDDGAPA